MIAYVTEVIVEGDMDGRRNQLRNSPKSDSVSDRSMDSHVSRSKSQKTRPLHPKESIESRSTILTKRQLFEERMRIAKQKREEELERKRLGVIAAEQKAEEFRKKQLEERKKKITEQKMKESARQQAVLNRRKKMEEESKKKILSQMNKTLQKTVQPNDARDHQKKYAFGSRVSAQSSSLNRTPENARKENIPPHITSSSHSLPPSSNHHQHHHHRQPHQQQQHQQYNHNSHNHHHTHHASLNPATSPPSSRLSNNSLRPPAHPSSAPSRANSKKSIVQKNSRVNTPIKNIATTTNNLLINEKQDRNKTKQGNQTFTVGDTKKRRTVQFAENKEKPRENIKRKFLDAKDSPIRTSPPSPDRKKRIIRELPKDDKRTDVTTLVKRPPPPPINSSSSSPLPSKFLQSKREAVKGKLEMKDTTNLKEENKEEPMDEGNYFDKDEKVGENETQQEKVEKEDKKAESEKLAVASAKSEVQNQIQVHMVKDDNMREDNRTEDRDETDNQMETEDKVTPVIKSERLRNEFEKIDRIRKANYELLQKSRMEALKRERERKERQQKEEEERLERKKKLESIMKRVKVQSATENNFKKDNYDMKSSPKLAETFKSPLLRQLLADKKNRTAGNSQVTKPADIESIDISRNEQIVVNDKNERKIAFEEEIVPEM
ncbi:DgyrCDS4103 [Dimorphilus gyrociliatus]|uniref:DgyrCDS4103 n=1 Tax=Dimorphilus gyrociliatus TaxID=2664684 RepID=A0A7I8VII9_9ANNE|nr:DgyrCDS4103 [Dimorphilus gyrociliatus]